MKTKKSPSELGGIENESATHEMAYPHTKQTKRFKPAFLIVPIAAAACLLIVVFAVLQLSPQPAMPTPDATAPTPPTETLPITPPPPITNNEITEEGELAIEYTLHFAQGNAILLQTPLTPSAASNPLMQNAKGHYIVPDENIMPVSFTGLMFFNAGTGDISAMSQDEISIDMSAHAPEDADYEPEMKIMRVKVLDNNLAYYDTFYYDYYEFHQELRSPYAQLASIFVFSYPDIYAADSQNPGQGWPVSTSLFSYDIPTQTVTKLTRDITGQYDAAAIGVFSFSDGLGLRWAAHPVPDEGGEYIAFSSNRRDYMRFVEDIATWRSENPGYIWETESVPDGYPNFAATDLWIYDYRAGEEYLLLENAEALCWVGDKTLIFRDMEDDSGTWSYDMHTGEKKKLLEGSQSLQKRIGWNTFLMTSWDSVTYETFYHVLNVETGELRDIDVTFEDYFIWRDPLLSHKDGLAYQTFRYQPDPQTSPEIDEFVILQIDELGNKTVYELPESLAWEWSLEVAAVLGNNRLLVSIDGGISYVVVMLEKLETT